jgi:hypothetical protein
MQRDATSPAELLTSLANGHIVARALHVLAELGVADALGDGVASADELAERTSLDAGALGRLLRLVAAYGVFAAVDSGYAQTPASQLLRSDHPDSLLALVRMRGTPAMWNGFTELAHAARTGKPVRDWPALVRYYAGHPDEAAIFDMAMTAKSRRVVPAVVAACDFPSESVVADVGGGRGHLLDAVLEANGGLRGILYDLPHVVAERAESARVRVVGGNFFEDAIPAADTYLLMDLLHDWTDDDARRILSAVRRSAPPTARVLIVETLVAETPGPHVSKTLDVTMLAVTGGRERTPSEHAALLAATGWRFARAVPTASQYSVVEAVAA